MTCGFLIQLVFCKEKKTMWFIGVEVQQETSAPPPKKKSWIRPCIWKTSLKLLCRRTLKEQRLSKILCSVFKLVNNKTNPFEWVNLITRNNICLERKGHFKSAKGQHNTLWTQFLAVPGAQDLEQLPWCRKSVVRF